MVRLQDKVAIVSGAGRGLGRGYARELAREGAAVVVAELDPVTASDTAREIEALGGQALAVATDVMKRDQVQAAVAAAEQTFGTVDILVNNAQIQRQQVSFEDTGDDDMGTGCVVIGVADKSCFALALQAVASRDCRLVKQ